MLRHRIACACAVALAACALPPQDPAAIRMAGDYDPIVKIPVDSTGTRYIAGALFEPEGSGPFPVVIVLSGCAGTGPDTAIVTDLRSEYLPKGIAILVIDSFTPRRVSDVCNMPDLVSPVTRAEDAYRSMDWLVARPEIDPQRIFVQGYSHGASAALQAVDAPIAARHDRKFAGAIAYYPYCYPNMRFSTRTIILVGAQDDWTPAGLCVALKGRANVEVTVYPGASHAFATPGLNATNLGHVVAYHEAAARDGHRRAEALIAAAAR